MDALTIIFGTGAVFGAAFLGWLYTKRGKKWLASL